MSRRTTPTRISPRPSWARSHLSTILRTAAVVLALLVPVSLPAVAQAATPTTSADLILDQAGVLDVPAFVGRINALPAASDTPEVGVLLVNDPSVRADTFDADVKTYLLRQTGSALLAPDGAHLRAGMLLIAISPDVRKIGVYAGAGVSLNATAVEKVISAMRDDARSARWDDAVLSGLDAYGSTLTPPTWVPADTSPSISAATVRTVLLSLGLVAVIIAIFSLALKSRERARDRVKRERQAEADRQRQEFEEAERQRRRTEALAWEGPGAAAIEAAVQNWRSLALRLDPLAQVGPYDINGILAQLGVVQANGGVPTQEQRLKKGLRALIEIGTSADAVGHAQMEAEYILREQGWEPRWRKAVDAALARIDKADEPAPGWVRDCLDDDHMIEQAKRCTKARRKVEKIDERVHAGQNPVFGERDLDGVVAQLHADLKENSQAAFSSLSHSQRQSIYSGHRHDSRSGNGFDLSSLILASVIANHVSTPSYSSSSSNSWSSPSPSTTTFSGGGFDSGGGGGFDGGSGSF